MNNEVVITCAVTGGGDTAGKSPHVPVTPKQIAAAAIEAAKAGAAIVHCHVRNPETGQNAFKAELFAELVERIRESETDVVINLTGGNGGAILIDDNKPGEWQEGSDLTTPEGRVAHAVELLPEICTLDMGLINFGENVAYLGNDSALRDMAKRMQSVGVKPELEVFDVGPIMQARKLMDEGVFDAPPMFQLCLGIGVNAPTDTKVMLAMRDILPDGAFWSSFGISRHQMPMVAKSVALGGNVRVGLEDNLYLSRGVLANNGQLVEKARTIIEAMGARVLTPAEAREKLNLRKPG
ncbi:MAG: NADPH:quinone reductase [Rhodospirillaceae bacterium]|nr:NADPH:quinone reductase [Rhodospirillaceae bacterium]